MGGDDDSDISDITLETNGDPEALTIDSIIRAAVAGTEGSFDALIRHPWTVNLVNATAARVVRDSRRDLGDVKEHLLAKLGTNIRKLKIHTAAGLASWLRSVGHNFGVNGGLHDNVVARHEKKSVAESVHFKMHDGAVVVHLAAGCTPESALEKKERRRAMLCRLRKLLNSLPDDLATVARLWLECDKPRDIIKNFVA